MTDEQTTEYAPPEPAKKLSGAQRKQAARQGTMVKLAIRKPRRVKVRRVPDVQIARGPVTAETYAHLRQAFKRRQQVKHGERWYRVAYLRTNDVGNFEARLVEVV